MKKDAQKICEEIADMIVDYCEAHGLSAGGGVMVDEEGFIVVDYTIEGADK